MVAEDANVQTHILGGEKKRGGERNWTCNKLPIQLYRYGLIIEPSEMNIKSTITYNHKTSPLLKKNGENCKCTAIPSFKLEKTEAKLLSSQQISYLQSVRVIPHTSSVQKSHRQQNSTTETVEESFVPRR